jgi:hypothetical protein
MLKTYQCSFLEKDKQTQIEGGGIQIRAMTAQDAANKFQTKAISKGLSMGPFIFVYSAKDGEAEYFQAASYMDSGRAAAVEERASRKEFMTEIRRGTAYYWFRIFTGTWLVLGVLVWVALFVMAVSGASVSDDDLGALLMFGAIPVFAVGTVWVCISICIWKFINVQMDIADLLIHQNIKANKDME